MPEEKGYAFRRKRIDLKKVFSIEGAIIIVLLITIFLLLNYLNIFSIRDFTKNIFNNNSQTPEQTTPASSGEPITLGCPVVAPDCNQGEVFTADNSVLGQKKYIVWRLQAPSAVFAVFEGTATESITPITETMSAKVINLVDTNEKYRAEYLFFIQTPEVASEIGDRVIGTVRQGQPLSEFPGLYLEESYLNANFEFAITSLVEQKDVEIDPKRLEGMILP